MESTRPPTDRDLLLDLVRAGALAVVVLWHWVFTTIAVHDDGPSVGNPVGVTPGLWVLTWVLQPMALFFAVGGCLHLRTYDGRPVAFVVRRFQRLVVPALPLLVPAGAAILAAHLSGSAALTKTLVLLISPMWFLAVYLGLVVLAPAMVQAHRRHPAAALVALVGAVVVLDVGRFSLGWSGPTMVIAGFIVVWALVHQLGFFLDPLRRADPAVPRAMVVAGMAGLIGLVWFGPYPASMVGVPGEDVSNMAPPNLAVVCLAVMQLGLLVSFAPWLERVARRRSVALGAASRWCMTVYVWHLPAWGLFFLAVRATGAEVASHPDAGWWLHRPLWLLGPAVAAIPICWLATRRERRQAASLPSRRPSSEGSSACPPAVPAAGSAVLAGAGDATTWSSAELV